MPEKEEEISNDCDLPEIAIALVHHPVVNKYGETVTSSVTTLDAHDMARLCKTYGVSVLYIVTPLQSHKRLVERVARHWTSGFGASYNPSRKRALDLVKVVDSIDHMLDNFSFVEQGGLIVATSAKGGDQTVSFPDARQAIYGANKTVLLFGTAHGLEGSALERANLLLEPVKGVADYNHLSVRAAAAIILDRLLGR